MKHFLSVVLFLFGAAAFCSAAAIAEDSRKGIEKADTSYAFGMLIAEDLANTGLEFNYNAFMLGFRDTMEQKEPRLTMDEAIRKVQAAFALLEAMDNEKRQREVERNQVEGAAFLAENAKRLGVVVTPSGLQYEVISEGTGDTPGIADTVLVHYRGTTIDGNVFDTTFDDDTPIEVPLDRVIPGWAEGLRLMKEGGRSIFYIPPELAYGERGAGSAIKPGSVIIFEVELLNIVRVPKEE